MKKGLRSGNVGLSKQPAPRRPGTCCTPDWTYRARGWMCTCSMRMVERVADRASEGARTPRGGWRRRLASQQGSTLGPRAPARGPSTFGRAIGHGRAHRGTWADGGAHAPTWLGPRSPTGIIRETRPRLHNGKARSSGSAEPACGDPRSPSPAPFVELHERQSTAQLARSKGAPPAASGTT